jgi:hypothetical protein
MNKERLHKLEYPLLHSYLGLWLLVYIFSRTSLEMYRDDCPQQVWIWLLIIIIPLSGYAALRAAFSQGGKWYHSFGYFLMFTLGGLFSGQYIIINGDILLSALIKTPVRTEAKVISVKKVIRPKLGFDHTDVRLQSDGEQITLEARPYSYFYLQKKSTILITTGTSFLGNRYVTSSGIDQQQKNSARWLHLKDWAYRYRLLFAIVVCMIVGATIRLKYFPEKPGVKPRKIGIWKLLGIIMAALIAIALILYAGLMIYVTFFVSR